MSRHDVEVVVGEEIVDSVEREEDSARECVGPDGHIVAAVGLGEVYLIVGSRVVHILLLGGEADIVVGLSIGLECSVEYHVATVAAVKHIAYLVGEYLRGCQWPGGEVKLTGEYRGPVEGHCRKGELSFGRSAAVGHDVDGKGIVDHYRRDEDVVVGRLRIILLGLPAAIIVASGPRGHRPAVVVLPYEGAHAVGHIAAVGLDGCLDGVALQDGAHVKESREVFRRTELLIHVFLYEVVGVGACALMSHHHFRVDAPVALLRSVYLHRFEFRE